MSLISQRLQIKKLNDRILSQNILIQTLIDVMIEEEVITEEELETKLDFNIKEANHFINSIEEETTTESDEINEIGELWYGTVGDC